MIQRTTISLCESVVPLLYFYYIISLHIKTRQYYFVFITLPPYSQYLSVRRGLLRDALTL